MGSPSLLTLPPRDHCPSPAAWLCPPATAQPCLRGARAGAGVGEARSAASLKPTTEPKDPVLLTTPTAWSRRCHGHAPAEGQPPRPLRALWCFHRLLLAFRAPQVALGVSPLQPSFPRPAAPTCSHGRPLPSCWGGLVFLPKHQSIFHSQARCSSLGAVRAQMGPLGWLVPKWWMPGPQGHPMSPPQPPMLVREMDCGTFFGDTSDLGGLSCFPSGSVSCIQI